MTYYVIVPTGLPANEFQLAATIGDAMAGNFIPFQQYPTLSNTAGTITVPISDVDQTDGTITFDSSPGFTTGQQVVNNASNDQAIGGLTGGTTYYAIVGSDPDTLQLSTTDGGTAIPLNLDPMFQGVGQGPSFRQSLPVTVNPSGDAANSIAFGFNAGFTLGDSFIYQGTGISGLNDGVRYWAIPNSSNDEVIQLADLVFQRRGGERRCRSAATRPAA